jgi:uncharacterized RDD family membrane protein YckC
MGVAHLQGGIRPPAAATDLTDRQLGRRVRWRRLAALVVDAFVVSILYAWINHIFGVTRVVSGSMTSGGGFITSGGGFYNTKVAVDGVWLFIAWIAYYAVLEALFGATIGKALAGLRVVDLQGRRIAWGASLLRNALRPIDALPGGYLLGGILVLTSPLLQRLGDRVAHTLVVPADVVESPPLTRDQMRRRVLGLGAALLVFVGVSLAFQYYGRPPLVIAGLNHEHRAFAHGKVDAYTLGPARWGRNTVTYPFSYRVPLSDKWCRGSMGLHWRGFFGGWDLAGANTRCDDGAPPPRKAPLP